MTYCVQLKEEALLIQFIRMFLSRNQHICHEIENELKKKKTVTHRKKKRQRV